MVLTRRTAVSVAVVRQYSSYGRTLVIRSICDLMTLCGNNSRGICTGRRRRMKKRDKQMRLYVDRLAMTVGTAGLKDVVISRPLKSVSRRSFRLMQDSITGDRSPPRRCTGRHKKSESLGTVNRSGAAIHRAK